MQQLFTVCDNFNQPNDVTISRVNYVDFRRNVQCTQQSIEVVHSALQIRLITVINDQNRGFRRDIASFFKKVKFFRGAKEIEHVRQSP